MARVREVTGEGVEGKYVGGSSAQFVESDKNNSSSIFILTTGVINWTFSTLNELTDLGQMGGIILPPRKFLGKLFPCAEK